MRSFLLAVIVLEALGLFLAGAALLFGIEERTVEPPPIPSFRPPVYDSVIGDMVRYQKIDQKTEATVGYLEYRVEWAEEYRGTNFGRTYRVVMVERDARARETGSRRIIIRPRDITHGWLPPTYEEQLRTQFVGAQPVIASIETASVTVLREKYDGFLVTTVIPRRSLTEISGRFWISERVPLFGVARFERDGYAYVLDQMEDARS